jgi:hypothetical protein
MKKLLIILLTIFPVEVFSQDNSSQDHSSQGLCQILMKNNYRMTEPKFSARLVTDIDFDRHYNSTDGVEQYSDTRSISRLFSRVKLNDEFALNTNLEFSSFNSVSGERTGNAIGDRAFEENGAGIEELALSYNHKNVTILAGKYIPNFGTSWRWGRGIWSKDIAQSYKQDGKLGFAGIYKAGDKQKTGEYNFGFAAFTNDRKNLDNSFSNKSSPDHKYDAKAGDTRSLQSYVASVDIDFDFKEGEELSYHFAYMNLAVNERASKVAPTKIDNQKGFVASGKYRYPLHENFLLDGLLEYVDMRNVGGDSDITDKYFNFSLVGEIYHNWNVTLAESNRKNVEIDQNGFDQNLSEISFGYKLDKSRFFDQLLLQVGYRKLRTNYKTSLNEQDSVGILARYIKLF